MEIRCLFNKNMRILHFLIILPIIIVLSDIDICDAKKNASGKVYIDSDDFAPIEMKERVYKNTGKEWSEFTDEEKQSYMQQWDEYQQSKKEKLIKQKKIAAKKERSKAKIKKGQDRREQDKIKQKQRAAKIKAKAKSRKKKAFKKKLKSQKKRMKQIRKRNAKKLK
ncbi:MAG: hypothetical protein KKD07_04645 [Candidatus Omnitrophica bacterium]|nr:hypothetical protein [Candidatus Omnitrophota bacterium]MBU1996287.1 hypothetical protein [Candidatus Omnitrophota bacterium]MBU4333711.1 hypothetical protein [Candidatus Omnitrophota bacterium]